MEQSVAQFVMMSFSMAGSLRAGHHIGPGYFSPQRALWKRSEKSGFYRRGTEVSEKRYGRRLLSTHRSLCLCGNSVLEMRSLESCSFSVPLWCHVVRG